MATLYELTSDYAQLLDLMGDPETDPQTIGDTMEGLEGEMSLKIDSYATVIKSLEADNDMDKKEIERLQKRVNSRDKNIQRMKDAMMVSMQTLDMKKLPTEHYKIYLVANGGLAPLKITGEVPAEYCKLSPDNTLIREALKEGELPFAELGERGKHIVIK